MGKVSKIKLAIIELEEEIKREEQEEKVRQTIFQYKLKGLNKAICTLRKQDVRGNGKNIADQHTIIGGNSLPSLNVATIS